MSAPSLPQVLVSMSRAGTLFNTYTTAKRVINDEDAFNFPGNSFKLGAHFGLKVRGGLSNIVSSPGNFFFQVMMGASNVIAFTSGNLAFNATARTLLPFTIDLDLYFTAQGTGTSGKFTGQGTFGGVHLTNTDQTIQVPTTAPAAGTGWDSVAAAGNVFDFFWGFSVSNAGNGVQLTGYDLIQYSGFAV